MENVCRQVTLTAPGQSTAADNGLIRYTVCEHGIAIVLNGILRWDEV